MKRKLDEDFGDDRKIDALSPRDDHQDLARDIRTHVEILQSSFSSIEADRATAKRAIQILSDFAKNGEAGTNQF